MKNVEIERFCSFELGFLDTGHRWEVYHCVMPAYIANCSTANVSSWLLFTPNHDILGMPRTPQALSWTESFEDFSAVAREDSYRILLVFTMNKQARGICGQHDYEELK